ncbi:radical SAM protein [Actinoplanes sp. KI2]|uniref:radical SAM protein n=1 Tax=Actinoplanes sp. KI2 TaxID=2983315 RepID=UPI0021D5F8E9|nr:radical SAM protein [Actinoplanes sp. KI2]MCU7725246.1 radical SAM protein [Actinoplanes sp. KI2]
MNRLERAKMNLLTYGVAVDPEVVREVTQGGQLPLVFNEYATTSGLSLDIGNGAFYVNAPLSRTAGNGSAVLRRSNDGLAVLVGNDRLEARILPLPGYLDRTDAKGRRVADSIFTVGDRARLSPITGCSMACSFCDLAGLKYSKRPVEQLVEALMIASETEDLRHVLISGGTPSRRDYGFFDLACAEICKHSALPVEVMMPPRASDPWFVDRLVDVGVSGFAINLETSGIGEVSDLTRQKASLGRSAYEQAISRAVRRLGRQGAVRSLVVVGLEPPGHSLEAIEWLASLGCDPVISPFRPAVGTPLEQSAPCSEVMLTQVFEAAVEIVSQKGVALGPRCVVCQNNVMAPVG